MSGESSHDDRIRRAMLSLDGLSVGDGFGECFFSIALSEYAHHERLVNRIPPGWSWRYTDDTEMAMAIIEVLEKHQRIDQGDLAQVFARRYAADDRRGYGGGAHQLLRQLGASAPWRQAAGELFDGTGSLGNGGAMRVGPLGAYFADDSVETIVDQARRSAQVTHAHPEGQAGAIAVALAAAYAWNHRGNFSSHSRDGLFEFVIAATPPSATRQAIEHALRLPRNATAEQAAILLGNGEKVTAPDTVPFTIWCAARHLDDYMHALWTTVTVAGDIDTNCAIVGSIVVLSDPGGVPPEWLAAREELKW